MSVYNSVGTIHRCIDYRDTVCKYRDTEFFFWPLKRSHFPMHDQSPGAVQGPGSIHSSQHIYGLIIRQTVFNFLKCYMLCFYCCLDQRKETMVHHLSQTEKGELNHYGTGFFSVTRGRSATSTFCTYCGGCSVPRHNSGFARKERNLHCDVHVTYPSPMKTNTYCRRLGRQTLSG